MSIEDLRAEKTGTPEWRRSVWLRRACYVCLLLAFVVAAVAPGIHQSPALALVPFLVGAVLQPAWHLVLRKAGVFEDTRWIGMTKIAFITDPGLRRHHRRAAFWLPG